MAIKEVKREWSPSQLAYVKEFLLHWESDVKDLPACCTGSKAKVSETGNEYICGAAGEWALKVGEDVADVPGAANKVRVTDGEGKPGWDDRKHWVELAAIAPEIFSDPSVEITYDAGRTEIGKNEFNMNADVEAVYFPNVVTGGSNMFYKCENLVMVCMPKLTDVGGSAAFQGCAKLQYVHFPAVEKLRVTTFRQCVNLREISLPKITALDQGSEFDGCTALQKVNVPEVQTLISCFSLCTSLERIDLPKAKTIGTSTFRGCSALTAVILRNSTVCALGSVSAFTNTPIASGTGYIYVPSALIEDYKAATNWSTYAAQFRAIEDYPEICDPDWDGHSGDVIIPAGKSLTLQAGATVNDEAGVLGGGPVSWNDLTDKPFGDYTAYVGSLSPAVENVAFEIATEGSYYDARTNLAANTSYRVVFDDVDYYVTSDANHGIGSADSDEPFYIQWNMQDHYCVYASVGTHTISIYSESVNPAFMPDIAELPLNGTPLRMVDGHLMVYYSDDEYYPAFPVAFSVADAAGDTPTAAEFNALLKALRNAGLMES